MTALIKCTECGKEFSDNAPSCPNCGCSTSEMVVQSEVAIEDGAKVSTCAAFLALAKEQFEKIPEYRAKVNEVIEEFAPVDAEYEKIGGKIKAYDKEITASYNEFRAAEEEYAQSCKGL